MKQIEITTAQKVTIQYELATLRDRILAYIVDMIILVITLILLGILVSLVAYESSEMMTILYVMVLAPVFLLYTLVFELVMNGRTPGKKALGIKVVKLTGGIPSFDDLLVRWVFRWLDIYTGLGAIAALLISAGDKSQRLGGLLSNTAVIKFKSSYGVRLSDIERMYESFEQYEPIYPGVTAFTDDEMLLVKKLLKRNSFKSNDAHTNLVQDTAAAIGRKLAIEDIPRNKVSFLQQVLRDYVMLTR